MAIEQDNRINEPARLSRAETARLKENLSKRYKGPLISFFRRRLGENKSEAEDLAQEVLTRVIAYDRPAHIRDGLLFEIAANLLRDRARRAKTRDDNQTDLENLSAQAEVLTPERVVQGKQELARVMALLSDLPPKTRNMFIQHRLEGLKYWEIAEQYGVSVSAVEKHIIKALSHLLRNVER